MNFKRNRCFFFVVFFTVISYFVTITSSCVYTKWFLTITIGISATIEVHIKSTDHDLGYHMKYSWKFCSKIFGTKIIFSCGPRSQTLALMYRQLMSHCHDVSVADQKCF